MKSSTKDKVEGVVKEATGTLKEKVGQAMDDPGMRDRGTAEKVGGKVQRKVGTSRKSWSVASSREFGNAAWLPWKMTTSFVPRLPNLGSARPGFFVRLSEHAHQIQNQAYNQNHTNAPAAISWAAKVDPPPPSRRINRTIISSVGMLP